MTFSITFAVIFVVNLTSKKLQDLVYGENIRTPSLNVVSIFFGIGQTRLPTRTFSRILLMIFVLFCLIIRTAYQGVQFEMLTSDMRRDSITKIEQLYEENFQLYMSKADSAFKKELTGWKSDNVIQLNDDELFNILQTKHSTASAKIGVSHAVGGFKRG